MDKSGKVETELWLMITNQKLKRTDCKQPCERLEVRVNKVYYADSRYDKASLHLKFVDPVKVITEEYACDAFCLIVELGKYLEIIKVTKETASTKISKLINC